MKSITKKISKVKMENLLKSFDSQLKTIMEDDIRNLKTPQDNGIKNAAFLQLIAA